ncbi:MAG TPA: DUF362 domain-containing protein [Thermomicrobiaceae bacterium]|nr:DUF362 domain-containing protein [Thermomicrobiaceae bacterium]
MGRWTSRAAAGAVVALGAAAVTVFGRRQVFPTAETFLARTGELLPAPLRKPNAYVDDAGRGLVAATWSRDPGRGVRRAVELLGGLATIDVADRRVVIKLNSNSGAPAPASTSPEALEAVIQLLQDHGAREVIVGEMSGPPWHNTAQQMARNGLLDVIENNGARFVDFRHDRWVTVPLHDRSRIFETLSIPRTLYEAERLIAVPALKTHRLAGFSLSIKLWFGAVHPRQRIAAHVTRDLTRAVAEFASPFWPDLVILDGGQAMVDGGPVAGEVEPAHLYLASGDRVALDVCGVAVLASFGRAERLGVSPVWEQPQIRAAIELGLGAVGPHRVTLVADPDAPDLAGYLGSIGERAGIVAGAPHGGG